MFVAYCLILAVFVYVTPALAFFPRLILDPRLFAITPIISALIIYCLVTILLLCDSYTHLTVIASALVFAVVAGERVRQCASSGRRHFWSKRSYQLYFFHALVLLPFFFKLVTHGFDRGDEIYSWNFWAMQHALSLPIDSSHTGAPYPQLLPKLLSYCYLLLGNFELQLPIKGLLIFFPYMMLNGIGSLCRLSNNDRLAAYGLSLIFVLFICGLSKFFDDAYADPLMTASMALSVVCFLQYYRALKQNTKGQAAITYYGFAVLTAIAGFLSKQPGLLWVAVLTLLTMFSLFEYRKNTTGAVIIKIISLVALMGISVVIWLRTEGHQFEHNAGVIGLSMGNRNLVEQLLMSGYRYLIQMPQLLLLFGLAFYAASLTPILKRLMWLYCLPGVILWLLFGAYQLRLGQQYIVIAWLVLVASQFSLPKTLLSFFHRAHKLHLVAVPPSIKSARLISIIMIATSVSVSAYLWIEFRYVEQPGISMYAGRRIALTRYFGADSQWIYDNLFLNHNTTLWVPSRYLYGLFYPSTNLVSPDYQRYKPYDQSALIAELKQTQPDYVFEISQAVIDGPAASELTRLIATHPQAFEKVADAPNRFNFVTYRIHTDKL